MTTYEPSLRRLPLLAACLLMICPATRSQSPGEYTLDDGSAELSVILVAGTEPRPTVWLNAFHASPQGDTITSLSVTWGNTSGNPSSVPVQAPTTLLLYQDDTSNDGDPRSATLIASVVLDHGAPAGAIDTGVFVQLPIPPSVVHDTFFVGALYPDPGQGAPAPLDTQAPTESGRSWIFSSAENAVNIDNLGGPLNFGGLIEAPPFGLEGNWLLHAEGSSSFTDLGQGLSGAHGVPVLTGAGNLQAGSPVGLDLTAARESSPTTLVLGLSVLAVPFKGGVLMPSPDLIVPGLTTDPAGALSLQSSWPTGIPPGTAFVFQTWVADPLAAHGFSASNGLLAITP